MAESKPESKTITYYFKDQSVKQIPEMDKFEPSLDYETKATAETLADLFGGETTVMISYVYKVGAKSEK